MYSLLCALHYYPITAYIPYALKGRSGVDFIFIHGKWKNNLYTFRTHSFTFSSYLITQRCLSYLGSMLHFCLVDDVD